MMRNFFLLWLRHFPRKMLEDNQNHNTVRNFSLYNIRFLKSSSKRSKNTEGEGSRLFEKNPNISRFFLGMAFLYSLILSAALLQPTPWLLLLSFCHFQNPCHLANMWLPCLPSCLFSLTYCLLPPSYSPSIPLANLLYLPTPSDLPAPPAPPVLQGDTLACPPCPAVPPFS